MSILQFRPPTRITVSLLSALLIASVMSIYKKLGWKYTYIHVHILLLLSICCHFYVQFQRGITMASWNGQATFRPSHRVLRGTHMCSVMVLCLPVFCDESEVIMCYVFPQQFEDSWQSFSIPVHCHYGSNRFVCWGLWFILSKPKQLDDNSFRSEFWAFYSCTVFIWDSYSEHLTPSSCVERFTLFDIQYSAFLQEHCPM